MAVVRSRRGLDLPLAGTPAGPVEDARATATVALLGADYPGLKPALKVDIGDRVALGQTLFEDKQRPGVRFTAPAGGTVSAIHRGARRSLVSVVISVDASIAPIEFAAAARARARPDAESVRELLLEAGLWPALRTRPFARVASPTDSPAAIFVTATDTRPHAIAPAGVIAARAEDFELRAAAAGRARPQALRLRRRRTSRRCADGR